MDLINSGFHVEQYNRWLSTIHRSGCLRSRLCPVPSERNGPWYLPPWVHLAWTDHIPSSVTSLRFTLPKIPESWSTGETVYWGCVFLNSHAGWHQPNLLSWPWLRRDLTNTRWKLVTCLYRHHRQRLHSQATTQVAFLWRQTLDTSLSFWGIYLSLLLCLLLKDCRIPSSCTLYRYLSLVGVVANNRLGLLVATVLRQLTLGFW